MFLAVEAQNDPHLAMLFRCMEYDTLEYARQLRELIGLMKCRRDKEVMQRYCRKHADRISKMDSATYDMVCTMLNLDTLQEKKEEYKNREEQEKYDMCKAMEEWAAESREEGRMIGLAEGEKKGRESGLMEGEKLGEQQLASLIGKLLQTGRQEDLQQALVDADARKRLYREFGI